jgi:hypothetical protein
MEPEPGGVVDAEETGAMYTWTGPRGCVSFGSRIVIVTFKEKIIFEGLVKD